jgi:hypothetical protein
MLLPAYNRKDKRDFNPEYKRLETKAHSLRKKGMRKFLQDELKLELSQE